MTRTELNNIVAQARRRADEFDVIDHANGNATPADAGVGETIRTSIKALEASLITEDWNIVAEAIVLLERFSDVR